MSTSAILQIFLMINMFIVGALAVIATQHAYAHFRPDKHHDPELPKIPLPTLHEREPEHLSPAVRQRWINSAEEHFADALTRTTVQLEKDLAETNERLDRTLLKMGTEMADDEMKHYRQILEQLRTQAAVSISGLGKAAAEHQAALKAELTQQAAAARTRLGDQMDDKLADTVIAFLTEVLQHEADLGAQQPYLLKQLEDHKAELISEVTRED